MIIDIIWIKGVDFYIKILIKIYLKIISQNFDSSNGPNPRFVGGLEKFIPILWGKVRRDDNESPAIQLSLRVNICKTFFCFALNHVRKPKYRLQKHKMTKM